MDPGACARACVGGGMPMSGGECTWAPGATMEEGGVPSTFDVTLPARHVLGRTDEERGDVVDSGFAGPFL